MKTVKKHLYVTDMVLAGCIALLILAVLWFSVCQVRAYLSGRKIYQSEIMLGDMEYNEEFLKEAQKIPGIRSVTPVMEIPVKLRAEGYTMEVSLRGVDLTELIMTVREASEVQMGNTPVLILGEHSIAMMEDANGHRISEKKQKELLERFRETDWQYCLAGLGETGDRNGPEDWKSCLIAGILSFPAEEIYLPDWQAQNLAEMLSGQTVVTRILVTVQGEKNYNNFISHQSIRKAEAR